MREGHLGAVQLLLDAWAPPDQTTFYGETLIEMATYRGYDAIVDMLAEALARTPRVKPAESRTDHPMHLAAEFGDVRRVARRVHLPTSHAVDSYDRGDIAFRERQGVRRGEAPYRSSCCGSIRLARRAGR